MIFLNVEMQGMNWATVYGNSETECWRTNRRHELNAKSKGGETGTKVTMINRALRLTQSSSNHSGASNINLARSDYPRIGP